MGSTIKKLQLLFNRSEKKKFLILFLMMIMAALLETLGIGLIIPFVEMVTNPDIIHENAILSFVYNLFKFHSTNLFLIFSVVILLCIFVFKNIYLLLYAYLQNKVILNQQVKLSRELFKEYLTKPYTFHLQSNTADLLRNVNQEVPRVLQGIIMAGFGLMTESLVIICILSLLLVTAPIPTVVAAILLGGSVFLFYKIFRKKMSELGKDQQIVSGLMIKWVNQGLGASKEVKVSGKENFFVNAYLEQSKRNAYIARYRIMLDQTPRLFLETLLVLIVLMTMLIIIFQGNNTAQVVSTMALFAMAAFRLMPSINRVMAMITSIRLSQPALSIVYQDLFTNKEEYSNSNITQNMEVGLDDGAERIFTDSIRLNDVSFRYPNQKEYSIKDVSLTIPIGQSVAFVGESGAGKTTLVDIILGLYCSEKGSVLVDGKNLNDLKSLWQRKIGYIPQSIFLSDDSIRGNVAFGIASDQIDDKAVWRALEQAHLKEFIESLPEKLETSVGERGVRLSGGQRQRIGIARALYHNPEILFMDEATSALDTETEKEIMKAIDGLKGEKTLIIIAHRLSTIENCDIVFKINKGRLVAIKNKTENSISIG
ncbi:ABC transporter ATP-binding protein [Neobacillus drentensis]|uniref:ABC transporter ATP-binding protein n=1 Tax=Neobacillus drentensis TaxID=220684 RepID=UPI00285DBF28|nr:ABC transporter ATP-binding protein [Neobacillus drentensis]MDR7239974.1 ABC-type multidrug transport system fused ATPase/permease subunit [Neobacillus drentensis]